MPTVRLGDVDSVTAGDVVYELNPVGYSQGTIDQVRALSANLTILQVSAENGRDWFGGDAQTCLGTNGVLAS